MEGGLSSPQDWLAGRAQAQGEVPRRQGGRSHGNRRIPSVASDNLPCASGSLTSPPRCQAAGRVCARVWRVQMIRRLGAHEGAGHCGNPAFSPKPLALWDSSCHPSCFLAGCIL